MEEKPSPNENIKLTDAVRVGKESFEKEELPIFHANNESKLMRNQEINQIPK